MRTESVRIDDGRKKHRYGISIAVAVFLVLVIGSLSISYILGGAEIIIEPKHRNQTVNTNVTAYPERRSGELSYEIMTLTETGERQVTATGEEQVDERASGIIEIIKSTPGTQRMVANTRFQTDEGLVFRIAQAIEVPGAVTDSSGQLVPGTLRVEVTADAPGEEFNLPAGTRFRIPGFAESGLTELYENIYAESRTSMSGGFSGTRFIIEPSELSTARQELQVKIRDELLQQIEENRPADHVVFPGSYAFTFEALPPIEYGGESDLVTIQEVVTLHVPIFNQALFASFLADATVLGYEGESVRIKDFNDLTFTYRSATTSVTNLEGLDSLQFNLSGNAHIIWNVDELELREQLAGQPRGSFDFIIREYGSSIQNANAVIRPVWARSFPDSVEDIQVIERITDN